MKNTILIVLLFALAASCKKEATVWESDWSAPIVNDTLTLDNLVNDSTLEESTGFYTLDLTRTLFDFDINSVVEIPDTSIQKVYTNDNFDNILVAPGQSFLTLIAPEEHDLALDDVQIKQIILRKGFIEITISNPFATKVFFSVTLPGATKDGVVFAESYEAPAGTVANPGVINKTVDLTGYTMALTGISGYDFNKIESQINVFSDPAGPSINFGNEHSVPTDITFRDIELDYARGYFGNRTISDTTTFNLDALRVYESGSVDLPALSLSFIVENGIKVGAQGILHTVSNENALGNVVTLTGSSIGNVFNIDPATGNWNTLLPSTNALSFSSANSNIENYLENLGVDHTVGYSIQLNPWGNISGSWDEIFPQSALRVKLNAQMPLAIGLDNLILRDTFAVDLVQDVNKTRIVSGELILNTSNGFPFSAEVSIQMLDVNGNVLHTVVGSEIIEASQFGSFNSDFNFNVANSNVHFVLPENVITDLNNVTHLIVRSKFNSTDPGTNTSAQMLIPLGAFLSVKLKTKFKSENRF